MKKLLIILTLLLCAGRAQAVKIADITRLGGQRTNVLTGLGLVYGLKGTGDGGDFLPAIKPLASMLGKFSDPATVEELSKVGNVALVSITATIPADGVRNGDKVDVYVTSIGSASSLKNGRLFVTPLQGPVPVQGDLVLALAQGPITIEDPSTATVGKVPNGAVMEVDLKSDYIDNSGRFTLIIEAPSASWATSSTIAKIINDAEGDSGASAVAVDPKNVLVTIPEIERARPDSFIARVQALPLPNISTEARVQINEREGTMILTGDVEISPVVIIHHGLTISTINPAPVPNARNPEIIDKTAIPVDTSNAGGAKLQDLVNALDQLKVPAEDRIEIVKELYKTGKLHAKLLME
jgi:flagellar P-ring protein precursor FlgI